MAVLGRRREPLHETVAGFDTKRVEVIEADITDATALDGAVAAVVRRFGHLDVNFANAGTNEPSGVNAFDDDAWERQRSVNLDAVICRASPSGPTEYGSTPSHPPSLYPGSPKSV